MNYSAFSTSISKGRTYAVDDELFNFLVDAGAEQPTQAIARRIAQNVTNKYINDCQLYYAAVRSNKIKKQRSNAVSSDQRQATLDRVAVRGAKLSRNQRSMRDMERDLQVLKRKLAFARAQTQDPVRFAPLLERKKGRNDTVVTLKGLGKKKLSLLIEHGIESGQELLEADLVNGNYPPDIKPQWKDAVRDLYQERERKVLEWEEKASDKQASLDKLKEEMNLEEIVMNEAPAERMDKPVEEALPPKFSNLKDRMGYNAQFIGTSRIDSVITTEFNHRKKITINKMMAIPAKVLKIDFNYKLASKVRVYQGPGKSFCPYKCIVTVQNEDAMTIYWRALKQSESITQIQGDLRRLKERLKRISENPEEEPIVLAYVDNCCTVEGKIKEVFPQAEVKLDPFHWLKRWDKILAEPSSQQAGTFRAMMSRALFNVEDQEYDRARTKLQNKKGRVPTHKEILREANSVIPNADALEKNVKAVLQLVFYTDTTTNLKNSTRDPDDQSPLPKLFLKNFHSQKVQDVISHQMSHVKEGCLSDPDPTVFNIHRQNSKGKVYVARGTNTNEADNLYLDQLTGKSIGLARADRLLWTFFEQSNDRKRINRLSEDDHGTFHTESLALINGLAKSCGYSMADLPFSKVTYPSSCSVELFGEVMGFNYDEEPAEVVANPTLVANPTGEHAMRELGEFLEDVDFDDDDSEEVEGEDAAIGAVEDTGAMDTTVDTTVDDTGEMETTVEADDGEGEEDDDYIPPDAGAEMEDEEENDVINAEAIEDAVKRLTATTTSPRETTFETFRRLTNNKMWVPFHSGTSPMTELDRAERELFEKMKQDYSRKARLASPRGYSTFADAWNVEVAKRCQQKMAGEDVILINCKSVIQMQEHFDSQKELREQAALNMNNNPFQQELSRTIRDSRPRQPTQVQPPQYNTMPGGQIHFGAPTVLNPSITCHAINPLAMINPNTQQPVPQYTPFAFQPRRPLPPPNPLFGYKKATWCIICGFRKKDHLAFESFGSKCQREYCAKCGDLKIHHPNQEMGPLCKNNKPPKANSPHGQWYG